MSIISQKFMTTKFNPLKQKSVFSIRIRFSAINENPEEVIKLLSWKARQMLDEACL